MPAELKSLHSTPHVSGAARTAQDLADCLTQLVTREVHSRLDAVERRVDDLCRRVELLVAPASASGVSADALSAQLKTILSSVLIDGDVLSRATDAAVARRLEAGGRTSTDEVRNLVEASVKTAFDSKTQEDLGSEPMKLLMEEKFRSLLHYLKTDAIPRTVRQAVKELGAEGVKETESETARA